MQGNHGQTMVNIVYPSFMVSNHGKRYGKYRKV